jgi:aspartate/glutamate racemase
MKTLGIVGGIEPESTLPQLLRGAQPPGLPFLDTTMIHVERAVTDLLG